MGRREDSCEGLGTGEDGACDDDLCSGARPQRHFHFFDALDSFGSLDQDEQQVDDGTYAIDGGTLQIGDGAWKFTISNNQLTLEPIRLGLTPSR